jgi:hypothetical protein
VNRVHESNPSAGVEGQTQRSSIPVESYCPPPYFHTPARATHTPKRIKSELADTTSMFFAQAPPTPFPARNTPAPQHTMSSTPPQTMKSSFFPSQPSYPQLQPQPQVFQAHQSYGNPLAPAQPNVAFLPLFNQTAAQRRVTVEYPAEFSGPSHAGRWTVRCVGE